MRMGHVQPKRTRRGVQPSDAISRTRAVSPSSLRASAIGFAPSAPERARSRMARAGASAPTRTPGPSQGNGGRRVAVIARLEEPAQVHPRVEAGHLVAVAVEGQRGPAGDLADAALRLLAPARVVHGGV